MKSVKELFAMEKELANGTATITKEQFNHEVDEQEGVRVCSHCGSLMSEGICVEGGLAYYCDAKCMIADGMTQKEFDEAYDDGEGDTYYTEWEEEMDDENHSLDVLNELLETTQELTVMEYKFEQDLYEDDKPTKEEYMALQRKKYTLHISMTLLLK